MKSSLHLLGISGSLRKKSFNSAVLRTAQQLLPMGVTKYLPLNWAPGKRTLYCTIKLKLLEIIFNSRNSTDWRTTSANFNLKSRKTTAANPAPSGELALVISCEFSSIN